jgi:hypothetical protein
LQRKQKVRKPVFRLDLKIPGITCRSREREETNLEGKKDLGPVKFEGLEKRERPSPALLSPVT